MGYRDANTPRRMARDDSAREPLLKRSGAIESDGKSLRTSLKLMNNPKFRAVLVQSLLSLTAFTFMARQTEGLAGPELSTLNDCGDEGCGFSSFYQLKGIVGVYGGFWGFTVVLIMLYLIRKVPPPGTELALYSLFTLAMLGFVIMSVVECMAVVLFESSRVQEGGVCASILGVRERGDSAQRGLVRLHVEAVARGKVCRFTKGVREIGQA